MELHIYLISDSILINLALTAGFLKQSVRIGKRLLSYDCCYDKPGYAVKSPITGKLPKDSMALQASVCIWCPL